MSEQQQRYMIEQQRRMFERQPILFIDYRLIAVVCFVGIAAFTFSSSSTTGVPVMGVPVMGVPITGVPVMGVPIMGVPVMGVPVMGVPIMGGQSNFNFMAVILFACGIIYAIKSGFLFYENRNVMPYKVMEAKAAAIETKTAVVETKYVVETKCKNNTCTRVFIKETPNHYYCKECMLNALLVPFNGPVSSDFVLFVKFTNGTSHVYPLLSSFIGWDVAKFEKHQHFGLYRSLFGEKFPDHIYRDGSILSMEIRAKEF